MNFEIEGYKFHVSQEMSTDIHQLDRSGGEGCTPLLSAGAPAACQAAARVWGTYLL